MWLVDRPNPTDQIMGGPIRFSDGSSIEIEKPLPDNGAKGLEITFEPKTITSLTFNVTKVKQNRPKPKVEYAQPKDIADANQVIAKSKLMFDLVRLALETDSTRVVTLSLSTFSIVPHIPGVKIDSFLFNVFHGGNELSWAPLNDCAIRIGTIAYRSIDNRLVISRRSIEAKWPTRDS